MTGNARAGGVDPPRLEPLESRLLLDAADDLLLLGEPPPPSDPAGVALEPLAPAGGLVYVRELSASVSAGGQVNQLALCAQTGSTLIAALAPSDPYLDVSVTLITPSGEVLGSADTGGAGEGEVLGPIVLPEDGTYSLEVRATSGGGECGISLTLNAIMEQEPRGASNDLIQTAEAIDAALIDLSPVGRRGAVLGQAGAADSDWYCFALTAGEVISVAAASAGGETMALELHDWDGIVPDPVTITNAMILDGPSDPLDPGGPPLYSKIMAPGKIHLLPVGAAIVMFGSGGGLAYARVVKVLSPFAVQVDRHIAKGLKTLTVIQPVDTTLLAVGVNDRENVDAAIHDFVAPADGTYYVRASADVEVDYTLIVMREVAFEAEPNGAIAAAQNIAVAGAVLGAVEAGDEEGDFYSFRADAGAELTIGTARTPGGPAGTGSLLDPVLELYGPAGVLIASDGGGGAGGSAELIHTAAAAGTYTVRVGAAGGTSGEYVLHVTGHNGDVPPFEVTSTSPPGGGVTNQLDLTVHLSGGVSPGSVEAADLAIDGVLAAADVGLADGNTLVFSLPTDLAQGPHELTIAGGAMTDLNGRPIEPFAMQLTYDSIAPRVIASSILAGQAVPAGPLTVVVDFDEPLATETIDEADIGLVGVLTGSHVPASHTFDAAGSTLTLRYDDLPDDRFTLRLRSAPDAFVEPAGNALDGEAHPATTVPSGDGAAGGDFVVSFFVDAGVRPIPLPLEPVGPMGSLVREARWAGWIHGAADVDDYTIDLAGGQTIAVVGGSEAGFSASVELLDASGSAALGSDETRGSWRGAAIQAVAVSTPGTYRLRIGSANGQTGTYQAELLLNAALVDARDGMPANGSMATAQSLAGGFIDLPGGASRAAVVGLIEAAVMEQWYCFTADAGQPVTVALADLLWGSASVELYDAAGNLLAVADGAGSAGRAIHGFVPAAAGTFHVRVVGDAATEYALVVVRGADFDAAGNDGVGEAAQDITAAAAALGSIGRGGLGRLFAYDAAAGQIRRIDPLTGAAVDSFASPLSACLDVGMATTPTTLIVAGSADEPIYEMDPLTGEVLRTLPNPAGNVLAAAYADGEIYLGAELTDGVRVRLEDLAVEVFSGSPHDPALWIWDMPLDETVSPWIWKMSQEQFDALSVTPGHGQNYEHAGYIPGADPSSYWFVFEDQGWHGGGDRDFWDIMIRVDELSGGMVRLTFLAGAAGYNFNLIRLEPEREVLAWDLKYRSGEWLEVQVQPPPMPAADVLRNVYILQYHSGSLTDYDVSWLSDILTAGGAAVDDPQVWAIYPAGGVDDAPRDNWPAGSIPDLQDNQAFIGVGDDAAVLLTLGEEITIESWTPPAHSKAGDSRHWLMWGAGTPVDFLPDGHSPADGDDEVLLHLWGRDFPQIDPRSPMVTDVPSFGIATVAYPTGLPGWTLWGASVAEGLAAGADQLWAVHGGGLSRIDPQADPDVEAVELPEVSGGSGAGVIAHELFIADGDRIEVYDLHTLEHRRTLSGAAFASLEAVGADEADPGDYYRFAVNLGDGLTITTASPPGGPEGLGSLLDPVLGLYDPTGRLIAINDNGAADGRNARIVLSGAAMTGEYTVRVHGAAGSAGQYVLHVAGHTGAGPEFRLDSAGPLTDVPPDHVVLSFSAALLLSSLDASDLSVGGASPGAYEVLGPATIAFDAAPALGADGTYDLALAAGSVLDLRGRPVAGWSGRLLVDRVVPQATVTPFDAMADPHALTVTFTDDVSAALTVDDLLLRDLTAGADVAAADLSMSYDVATGAAVWTFPGLPGARLTYGHEYRLALPGAAVWDEAGNPLDGDGDGTPGGDCVVTFLAAGPGDVDGDGEVGYGDYAAARDHVGQTGVRPRDGDTNSDGTVDGRDYLTIKRNYGHVYAAAEVIPVVDAPADIVVPASAEGAVFRGPKCDDLKANGERDADEPGLSGWAIERITGPSWVGATTVVWSLDLDGEGSNARMGGAGAARAGANAVGAHGALRRSGKRAMRLTGHAAAPPGLAGPLETAAIPRALPA